MSEEPVDSFEDSVPGVFSGDTDSYTTEKKDDESEDGPIGYLGSEELDEEDRENYVTYGLHGVGVVDSIEAEITVGGVDDSEEVKARKIGKEKAEKVIDALKNDLSDGEKTEERQGWICNSCDDWNQKTTFVSGGRMCPSCSDINTGDVTKESREVPVDE